MFPGNKDMLLEALLLVMDLVKLQNTCKNARKTKLQINTNKKSGFHNDQDFHLFPGPNLGPSGIQG